MSLYPTLEDMQVSRTLQAQAKVSNSEEISINNCEITNVLEITLQALPSAPLPPIQAADGSILYPALGEYMGLELTPAMVAELMGNQQMVPHQNQATTNNAYPSIVAPVSGLSPAASATLIQPGLRELIVQKGADKKVGVRVKEVNRGIFVCVVVKDSPAALAGLKFGDQIVQVNGTTVLGFSDDKFHSLLDKSAKDKPISLIIRDRPFERTITLQKDSKGNVGFLFSDQKITHIVTDSSAARNGLLIDHHILEIDGQNVVGMKDKEISKVIAGCGVTVTLTIIPSVIFNHIMKNLKKSFIREKMDHTAWEF